MERALSDGSGCTLCLLEGDTVLKYLEGLLYEHVNEVGIRKKLIESRGFCHRHGHLLMSMGDGAGTAILFEDQMNLFLAHLAEFQKGKGKKRALPSVWNSPGKCPACVYQEKTRKRQVRTFIEILELEKGRVAFQKSGGLCVPHFLYVLGKIEKEDLKKYLFKVEEEKAASLSKELQDFIKKQDFRYEENDFGSERNAWIKAVKMVAGRRDLF